MQSVSAEAANAPLPFSSASLEVVVFDCDGVLFDSSEANVRFYTHILGEYGLGPIRPEQREYIHMHPVRESLRYLIGDGAVFERALDYSQKMDFMMFNAHLHREPGLMEVLTLAKAHFRTAVATNRTVSTLDVLRYHKLDGYFDLVVSASDVKRPKPHPDAMERILQTFGVTPDKILFIGDSPVDEGCALAAGVFFGAYKNPKLQAHLHLTHFRELQELLDRQIAARRTRDIEN